MSGDEQGFTLIETLIAFMILSLGLMISAQTIALATKSFSRARDDRAVRDAMNHIDQTLLVGKPGEAPQQGVDGLTRWRAERVAVSDEREGPQFTIVHITSPAGRQFEFLRFGTPQR